MVLCINLTVNDTGYCIYTFICNFSIRKEKSLTVKPDL